MRLQGFFGSGTNLLKYGFIYDQVVGYGEWCPLPFLSATSIENRIANQWVRRCGPWIKTNFDDYRVP